jgi:hypothetical protein
MEWWSHGVMLSGRNTPVVRHSACATVLLLQIWDQLPNVFGLDGGDRRSFAQLPLALLSLARKQVALKPFVPLDLAAAGYSEPFSCRSVGLNLRQFASLSI